MVTAWLILAAVLGARGVRSCRAPLARHDRKVARDIADWDRFAAALRTAEK